MVVLGHDVVLFSDEKINLQFRQNNKKICEKLRTDTLYKTLHCNELVSVDVVREVSSGEIAAFLLREGPKFRLYLVVNFRLLLKHLFRSAHRLKVCRECIYIPW